MVIQKALRGAQAFIKLESASGIILFIMAILALIIDNSPLSAAYQHLLALPFTITVAQFSLEKSLLHWVNDGLMTIFFLLVGLEIKREIITGELNSRKKFTLPAVAALGGMLFPALIYLAFNHAHPIDYQGWAIPTATDIAFALGVLTLLGNRVPVSVKIFLTALAILDDLGAIVIIAIFYVHQLSWLSLSFAGVCIFVLYILNRMCVSALTPYILMGILLWICVLNSGIHATLAGVLLAMFIPIKNNKEHTASPLTKLETALHPWVAFLILPMFAFFNAGISFAGIKPSILSHTVTLGIAVGLVLGKQFGVFTASYFAVKTGIAKLPTGMNWHWLYGVSLLCGIGFTMSLFIGNLAFSGQGSEYAILVRIGVLIGSMISGLLGYLLLRMRN